MNQLFLLCIIIMTFNLGAWGQACLPNAQLVQNWSNGMPAGSDGYTHTTYTFIDSSGNLMTPDASTSASVTGAIAEWNNLKGTSKVEFDVLPSGKPANQADLQIELTTDASGSTGGCAAYNSATGRIYYGSTFQSALNANIKTTIIAHELGHSVGLADGGTNPQPPAL